MKINYNSLASKMNQIFFTNKMNQSSTQKVFQMIILLKLFLNNKITINKLILKTNKLVKILLDNIILILYQSFQIFHNKMIQINIIKINISNIIMNHFNTKINKIHQITKEIINQILVLPKTYLLNHIIKIFYPKIAAILKIVLLTKKQHKKILLTKMKTPQKARSKINKTPIQNLKPNHLQLVRQTHKINLPQIQEALQNKQI
ncbi:hypothetical protein TTHERM_000842689 (macronuclear) [Tetrahymena thermophila SB210]|uniref:Uncharacterized protein n=1 Tax=Tetrahymena thermophila (strain SB210) TaxID=312017 RepID=W7XE46_TETTS|nr:hypothetical protein TTHERM_000842689 [Tetrahymena thermophila SB210]EWS71134.1 hypothetical protein TTHERM_000842689 [Tetrahymena thermophila SB210]|eukprot:XP_012656342.1 hypothetical protein TTHERM_000842689 [Tetrahymena thermophila SB210]